MSYITLMQGKEARKALLGGAKKMHDAVASSMGPAGRNMYFEQHDNVYLTKDGATIARWIHGSRLIDSFERAGTAIMRKPSMKTEEEAGDGTTAATVLSYAMMLAAEKYVDEGLNVLGIERGMRKAFDAISTYLDTIKRPASDRDAWEKVAYISSRDKEIAETIGKAMEAVGPDGHIRVEEGDDWREHELTLEIKQGMTFPRGYATDTAINDRVALKCILKDVPILVTDMDLYTEMHAVLLAGIAQACYKQGYKKLVIIGKKFAGRVTDLILQNNLPYHKTGGERGDGMIILPVEAPGFGTTFTDEFCDDIAVLTGAKFISDTRGTKLSGVPIDENVLRDLGRCEVIEAGKKETNIINSKANKNEIEHRIAEIKAKHEAEKGELEKRKYQERLAMLTTGMAVITVGGRNTENIGEKKARVDDAVLATKCAHEEGIVPGGGISFVKATQPLLDLTGADESEEAGIDIVEEAMTAPILQIAKNCCIDMPEAALYWHSLGAGQTYNMSDGTLKTVDAFEDGVVDPLKVVRSALLNAIEGALTFITTETVGVSLPEDTTHRPIWEVIRGDAADSKKDEKIEAIPCGSDFYNGPIIVGEHKWEPKLIGRLLRWLW